MSLAPLHRFLLEAFASAEELRGFLVLNFDELAPALPEGGPSRETFTLHALEVLRARGYFLDEQFFVVLARRVGPRRVPELARLAAAFIGDEKARQILIVASPAVPPAAPPAAPPPPPVATEPLRVLILAANPVGWSELDLSREATLIEDALTRGGLADRVRVDTAWAVTGELLVRNLLRYKPHVVHFGGHGNERGEPMLLDAEDQGQPASLDALARLFRGAGKQIRCVVFNACYAARVAQELVDDVPVVVGMRLRIKDGVALTFAEFFYRAVAEGKDLRAAFEIARAAIEARGLAGVDLPQMNKAPDVDPRKIVLLPALSNAGGAGA